MDDIARRSKRGAMKSFSTVKGNVHITLDMSRFKRQFQRAQYQLDGAVMESMVPFMPMITGSFINTTRAASAAVLYMLPMVRRGDSCMKEKAW